MNKFAWLVVFAFLCLGITATPTQSGRPPPTPPPAPGGPYVAYLPKPQNTKGYVFAATPSDGSNGVQFDVNIEGLPLGQNLRTSFFSGL